MRRTGPRLRRFTDKWIPRWQKYKEERNRNTAILVLLLLAVAAAVLWWLYGSRKDAIGPTDVPVLRPLPTASVVEPEPERFNQAAPTDAGDKPPR